MSLADRIFVLTVGFLNGWMSLPRYRNVFVSLMAETRRGEAANELIRDIEGEFAELAEGTITEAEFRTQLTIIARLQNVNAVIQENTPKRASGTVSNVPVFSAAVA